MLELLQSDEVCIRLNVRCSNDIAQVKGQGEDITAIYLHENFFLMKPGDETKQYGVIVHEMTHFRLTGDTTDQQYGKSAARALAKKDPSIARQTASNYHYYAQSIYGD